MRFQVFLIFLFFPFVIFAQGEANTWYFGNNAGLDFNTSPPSVLANGQLNTNEGCSTISGANGNLLFYTDGRTVWNGDHQIMDNGDYFNDTGLLGDPSSTSSGLIVPYPGNPDLYYIFTVDEPHHDNAAAFPDQGPASQNGTPTADGNYTDVPAHSVPQDDDGFNNGLTYSIVDMSLNNGLGNVMPADKNTELQTYNLNNQDEIRYKCSEKITAVKGADCSAIWIITHFVNRFYAFKIDENGLDTQPVVSTVGPTISTDDYRRAAIGYLKASPDGSKLLIAHNTRSYNQIGTSDTENGGVWLYDFDRFTGEVSNNQKLVDGINSYGVEFSTDVSKAYASITQNENFELLQWNLESPDIPNSVTEIQGTTGRAATALQLAPDGKIYTPRLGSSTLSVINNPNAAGNACNYSESTSNGAIGTGNIVNFGLPPFIQSFFADRVNIVNDSENIETELKLCDGENFTLGTPDFDGASYTWVRNGDTLENETSNNLTISQPQNIQLPYQESYLFFVERNDGTCPDKGFANVTYYPFPETKKDTLFNCFSSDGEGGSFFQLENADLVNNSIDDEPYSFKYYRTSSDAQNEINPIENINSFEPISNQTNLTVKITGIESGCSSFAELTLESGDIDLDPVTLEICNASDIGDGVFDLTRATDQLNFTNTYNVSFYEEREDAILQQFAIANESNYENRDLNEQTVFALVENAGDCMGIVPVYLVVNELIPLQPDKTIPICVADFNTPIRLNSGVPNGVYDDYTYEWTTSGKTTQSILVSQIGIYQVEVTQKATGCVSTRTISLRGSGVATFSLETTEFDFDQNTIRINVSPESLGDYVYALDDDSGTNFQTDPFFDGVSAGTHVVYVKDLNGCGITQKQVTLVSFMRFFTPNQDGTNDRWRLIGFKERDLSAIEIYIFDRYGKLLENFNGEFRGWDGTFNGKKMPSNEYWYRVKVKNGQVYRGHFTLKR